MFCAPEDHTDQLRCFIALLLPPLLLFLVLQVLMQAPSLRHQGLTRLLATRDPTQQQALMGLDYPLLQLVVGAGDVGLVVDMIEDISDSLTAAPTAGAAAQGPDAPAAAGGGGGGAEPAPGAAPALVLPDPGGDFRAARVALLRLLRQVGEAGGRDQPVAAYWLILLAERLSVQPDCGQ